VGGSGSAGVPAWPPSPKSCTQFRKILPLISLPSVASNTQFLVKAVEMERNCLNAFRNFSLSGPTGVEYDSNFWDTEGFDLSVQSLVEEKAHCQRPEGQPDDCAVSGQGTPRAGCKKGVIRCPRFLQRILPTPASHRTGTSRSRGCMCGFAFNSSQRTLLP